MKINTTLKTPLCLSRGETVPVLKQREFRLGLAQDQAHARSFYEEEIQIIWGLTGLLGEVKAQNQWNFSFSLLKNGLLVYMLQDEGICAFFKIIFSDL